MDNYVVDVAVAAVVYPDFAQKIINCGRFKNIRMLKPLKAWGGGAEHPSLLFPLSFTQNILRQPIPENV